jgi:hypothetical protein
MGKNDEALIQVSICKYLQSEKIYFFSIPNEAAGENKVRQMQMVSMGLRSGVADMEVWLPLPSGEDLVIYVEVKNPEKWVHSKNQKKFEKRCKDTGKKYFLVFSVDDMRKIVEDHKNKYWSEK